MAYPVNGLPHSLLPAFKRDLELAPAGVHVHGGQGVEVLPPGALPSLGHEIYL